MIPELFYTIAKHQSLAMLRHWYKQRGEMVDSVADHYAYVLIAPTSFSGVSMAVYEQWLFRFLAYESYCQLKMWDQG